MPPLAGGLVLSVTYVTLGVLRISRNLQQPNIKMKSETIHNYRKMFVQDLPPVPGAEVRYPLMAVVPGRRAVARMQTFASMWR